MMNPCNFFPPSAVAVKGFDCAPSALEKRKWASAHSPLGYASDFLAFDAIVKSAPNAPAQGMRFRQI